MSGSGTPNFSKQLRTNWTNVIFLFQSHSIQTSPISSNLVLFIEKYVVEAESIEDFFPF